ncbi:helix-turn-helix domain-containing protein [Streptomyces sp. 3MP-14]|uniref:Helix-turn-helix domain-containing protein n=1 Tax=Streptomyces mimosae TaxID=2586635 RepID=A0A5N6A413_9ACTN|nr:MULTISPECIES: helix-turn-helix transcriptional regulator [Streptomyces]KAB8162138.1 helix-turn-helix domain-containing protein [Streptomyces mimosae]KAB8173964.1 helix-turn-helix domain-containing protein [Streptomyces sp. 3MP-14]
MATNNTSTVLMSRIALGRALRRLRDEEHGLKLTEVAKKLGCDDSMLSRIENGKRACSQEMLGKLMDLFQVSAEQREELARLQADSNERRSPWWAPYRDVISSSYEQNISFENAAQSVREYQLALLPGLLQTEEYARAVTSVGFASLGPDQIDGLVEVRLMRQRKRLLETETPLQCHYVITQAALEFEVGGRAVHRQQLDHLLGITDRPEVKVQVIPYEKGEEGCQIAGFRVYEFPGDVPEVAFSESVAGSVPIDDPRDLRRLNRLFRALASTALGPDASRDLVARIKDRKE